MNLIEIEIGTTEEKEKWKREIESILKALGDDNIKKFKIYKVIIASNFDKTVNELKGINNYQSKRYAAEAQAIALNDINGNNYIVVSGDFWVTFDNYELKFLFLLHEIYQIVNGLYLAQIINNFNSESTYLAIIYLLYNEYSAVRFSVSCLSQNQNIHDIIKILYDGNMSELQNPETFYLPMKKVIDDFRNYGMNINEYIINIHKFIDPILKYVANIFAFCHCYPGLKEIFNIFPDKIFITEDLIEIFNTFNFWYEREKPVIYENCLELVENYLKKLGISYTNVKEGVYVTVLDI